MNAQTPRESKDLSNDSLSGSNCSKKLDISHCKTRIAWLNPDMKLSYYIQPVLRELSVLFPELIVYTGRWSGYVPGCEDTFNLKLVGKERIIRLRKTDGYSRIIQLPSLKIIPLLWHQEPQIVFVVGLSLWALFALLLKPVKKWRVIIVYSGSSPNVDMRDSKPRLLLRQFMSKLTDAFITNSQGGKAYLVKELHVSESRVFARPYQIPDRQALLDPTELDQPDLSSIRHPVFLYIGQTTHRKGLSYLLQSCALLEEQNCKNYTVLIVGDGPQREEFEKWSVEHGLEERIKWLGWGRYGQLGTYYQQSDVFIFPTLEDIWGMVVLEAMLFEKPILCSKDAGVAEMIMDGKNGYVFSPKDPQKLAELMKFFIDNPHSAKTMGKFSLEIIEGQDMPQASALNFSKVINLLLNNF